jgi:hypothetical protein
VVVVEEAGVLLCAEAWKPSNISIAKQQIEIKFLNMLSHLMDEEEGFMIAMALNKPPIKRPS